MIRVIKSGRKYYGREIESVSEDEENIEQFVGDGTPVILVDELTDLAIFDIDWNEVEMVEGD